MRTISGLLPVIPNLACAYDDLIILEENVSTQLGIDSVRRFGRRWQLDLQFHF